MTDDSVSSFEIDGKQILLIATAHISQASVELVKEVIDKEQPDSICIELDEKRYENIKNPKKWEQTDIVEVVKTHRVGFMLANLALSSYQKKMAQKLGTTVGGEMLQGIKSAEEIDAQLVLADRDIQTTFMRVWRKLTLWEKCKLLVSIFFTFDEDEEDSLDEEDLRELLESDVLEGVLADMDAEFPKIGDILINERDQYLSQKIKKAPGKKVVAILGAAHVPGVSRYLTQTIDLTQLTTIPPKKKIGKIIGWAIPLVIIALFIYGFVIDGKAGIAQLSSWFLWTGGLAALFTLLVLGHPFTILTSFFVAPFSALNPFLAVGWFSGLVQAGVQKPTVRDLYDMQDDISSIKGLFKNRVLKVLLVVIFANIGASLGTFIAGAGLIKNLFGG